MCMARAKQCSHHDDAVIHQVVLGIIRPHEIDPEELGHSLDFFWSATQANHAGMELMNISLDFLGRVTLWVNGNKHRLHLDHYLLFCDWDPRQRRSELSCCQSFKHSLILKKPILKFYRSCIFLALCNS
jgi:hypothetical protein